MSLHGISHGLYIGKAGIARLPPTEPAYAQGHYNRCSTCPATLLAVPRLSPQLIPINQRAGPRLRKARQARTQLARICEPAFNALRSLGMTGQPGLDFGTAHRVQALIDVGVKFFFTRNKTCHFNLRKAGGRGLSSVNARKASRARDRRDMTVPTGMPNVWAASL
ncbi:hypothetical protein EDP1_3415 [Pseudomonas putida S610]|nr:hypothetical protein EDP1_3415 [Pseudomonas putida S610]